MTSDDFIYICEGFTRTPQQSVQIEHRSTSFENSWPILFGGIGRSRHKLQIRTESCRLWYYQGIVSRADLHLSIWFQKTTTCLLSLLFLIVICVEDTVRSSTVASIYMIHVFKIGDGLVLQSDTHTYNLMATRENCRTLSSGTMSHCFTLRRQHREFLYWYVTIYMNPQQVLKYSFIWFVILSPWYWGKSRNNR